MEYSLDLDETIMETKIGQVFPVYLNTCGSQGSRTIRTEVTVMRRGVFVGVVYYIDNVFTVQKARMRSGIRQ